MAKIREFFHYVGHPFRSLVAGLMVLINLTRLQMRALFSLAMIGGMISLSFQNLAYTYLAQHAVEQGDTYRPFFSLVQEQMRFNSGLIAWFAIILGLIVFGADYLRAKHGDTELSIGKGDGNVDLVNPEIG